MIIMDVLSAGIGLASSLGSSFINSKNQTSINNTQVAQAEANRYWNSEEARKQRYWQSEENRLAQQFNSSEAEKSRYFNSLEAKKAYERELAGAKELMQLENDYNSPVNQLKLLREAGVNPMGFNSSNFIASSGQNVNSSPASSSPASSSPASGASAGGTVMPNLNFVPLELPNPALIGAQARLTNAQAEKLEGENAREQELQTFRVESLGIEIALSKYDLEHMKPTLKKQIEADTRKIDEETSKITSEIKLNGLNEQLLNAEVSQIETRWQKYLEETDSRIRTNNAQAKNIAKATQKIGQEIDNLIKTGKLIDEQVIGEVIRNGTAGLSFQEAESGHEYVVKYNTERRRNQWSVYGQYGASTERATAHYERDMSQRLVSDPDAMDMIFFYKVYLPFISHSLSAAKALR